MQGEKPHIQDVKSPARLFGILSFHPYESLRIYLWKPATCKITALISCLDSNSFQHTCNVRAWHRPFLPQEEEAIPVTGAQHQYQQLAKQTSGKSSSRWSCLGRAERWHVNKGNDLSICKGSTPDLQWIVLFMQQVVLSKIRA